MEEFALFTGRCNFLDHKLDATYTLSTGAKWRYHSTYCGEIDASNRHYGDGRVHVHDRERLDAARPPPQRCAAPEQG